MKNEKCFACDRPLPGIVNLAWTSEPVKVHVGPDCRRKIVAAGAAGYQPPKGGPKLFSERRDA